MRTLVYLPFQASAQGLLCDGVSVQSIVDRVGTPVYVYSAQAIRHAYQSIDAAFADYPHAIHYALKANSTLAIVRLLRSLGSRADANSGGEVTVALRAGFDPKDIVLTGVGKTIDELEMAIAKGVGTINAESAGELDRVAEVARSLNRVELALIRAERERLNALLREDQISDEIRRRIERDLDLDEERLRRNARGIVADD